VRLENDELKERLRFIDQKYTSLVQRCGASPEDLQEIDEQLRANGYSPPMNKLDMEDDEAHVIYQGKSQ
jgi:hypothetical protein